MAEIKIEKKNPIWPWILLIAAILLALIYFLFFTDDEVVTDDVMDDNIEVITDDTVDEDMIQFSDAAISKINAYQTYISNEGEMGLEHKYSHSALTKLIDATDAVANTLDVDVNADLDRARANADHITKDTYDVDHANKIKSSANIIVQALKKIQTQKFPNLDESCTELQNSVMEITPGSETLEQKAAVKNFFEQAGELLNNMKNN